MKTKKITVVFVCFLLVFITSMLSCAHPGRLDSNGGHYDHSTGEYHYHDGTHHSGGSGNSSKQYDNDKYPHPDVEKRADPKYINTYSTKSLVITIVIFSVIAIVLFSIGLNKKPKYIDFALVSILSALFVAFSLVFRKTFVWYIVVGVFVLSIYTAIKYILSDDLPMASVGSVVGCVITLVIYYFPTFEEYSFGLIISSFTLLILSIVFSSYIAMVLGAFLGAIIEWIIERVKNTKKQ